MLRAAGVLLGLTRGGANECALNYRNHLVGRGLTPATVNRRLAALRSLGRLARALLDRALAGDVAAAQVLLAYCCGRPGPAPDADALDL